MFISLMRALIGGFGSCSALNIRLQGFGLRSGPQTPSGLRCSEIGTAGPVTNCLVGSSGIWAAVVDEAEGGQFYKFRVTGAHGREVLKADPMARQSELPPGDASIIPSDSIEFEWSDRDWMAGRGAVLQGDKPLRIYEVHAMSWRADLSSWEEIADALISHVQRLDLLTSSFCRLRNTPLVGHGGIRSPAFSLRPPGWEALTIFDGLSTAYTAQASE